MQELKLEKLGVDMGCDPDMPITLPAHVLGDLVMALHFHRHNLLEANRMLLLVNPDSMCEHTATTQGLVYGVSDALGEMSTALLRSGYAQGLKFVESESGLPVENPEVLTRSLRRSMMAAAELGKTGAH